MDRINTASKAVDLFGVGKHGWKNRNVATGVEPTDFNAEWCNGLQEEVANVIEGASIVLDDAVRTQLATAIAAMINTARPVIALGQCRLSKSGANLILLPHKGNRIMVNGVSCTVPDAGVTLAPPAVASTTYNIYAVATAGVITSLEQSATAHTVDVAAGANKGVEIKTGDPTRSFVGLARTTSGNAWADTRAQRFVRSWFNGGRVEGGNFFANGRSTTSLTYVELSGTERVEFLSFLGETVGFATSGRMVNLDATGNIVYVSVGIDSTTVAQDFFSSINQGAGSVYGPAVVVGNNSALAEGYHYATILAKVGGSTGSFDGGATSGVRTSITVTLG